MLVTLVNPPALVARFNYSTLSHPPIGLAYIASFLRARGHSVRVVDAIGAGMEIFEPVRETPGFLMQGLPFDQVVRAIDPSSRIIGFSCMFTHSWPVVRRLVTLAREKFPNAVLVAGGEHATAMAELCLSEAPLDCCVLGEGEMTVAELADAIEAGRGMGDVSGIIFRSSDTGGIVRTKERKRISPIDSIPWPAWDLVTPHVYRLYEGPSTGPTMPMVASRGCPFKCSFCSSFAMWKKRWEARDPAGIVDEMEEYARRFGTREFQFSDISPFVDRDWAEALCREIIGRGLDVSWQVPAGVRVDLIDKEMAWLLARSGFRHIQYAFESGSPAVLGAMNKGLRPEKVMDAVNASIAAGMKVCVLFIIGYPGETMEDVKLTWKVIRRLAAAGVHEIAISSFVPLPGTSVFEELCSQGRIRVDDGFLLEMASATSLTHAASWNPGFTGRKILFFKWLGILQFYIVSFMFHPARMFSMIRNIVSGVQESKTERAVLEIGRKIVLLMRNAYGKGKH